MTKLLLPFLILIFSSCDQDAEFRLLESASRSSAGAECVEGKRLSVWLDTNNDKIEDVYRGTFTAYSGSISTFDNYGYYSFSAHPKIGPSPKPYKSNVFFYDSPDGLGMIFFHNIDAGGSADNKVRWFLEVSGNNSKDDVIISDDNKELKKVSEKLGVTKYDANFHYWKNTDGGAIGPFVGNQYKVAVTANNSGDISDAQFYSANGESFSLLKDGESEVSSFIIKYEKYETCK